MNSLFILASPYVKQEFIDALSLKGNHQIENLALVTNAINYLFKNIDDNTIIEGLKRVKNPFRFEYFHNKNLIVDASHNPNGIMALKENLDFYFPNIPRRFVFGCLRNKDYKRMMQILFIPDDEIYFNEFDYPNATSYNELSSVCVYPAKKYDNEVIIQQDKLNVICGSFYMIGGMKWLKSLQV